jgi:hypothetical protein
MSIHAQNSAGSAVLQHTRRGDWFERPQGVSIGAGVRFGYPWIHGIPTNYSRNFDARLADQRAETGVCGRLLNGMGVQYLRLL